MKSRIAPMLLLLASSLGGSGCVLYGATTGWRGTGVEGVLELPERAPSDAAGPFVIYLERGDAPAGPADDSGGAEVRHDGEGFRPALVVARAGSGLTILNQSGVHHRLFWFASGQRHAVALLPEPGAESRLELDDPGVARIYCELHPDEHFTAFAVPTALYTVVEEPGHFGIDSVPPGSWRLHVWSEDFEPGIQEIEVEAFETRFHPVPLQGRAKP